MTKCVQWCVAITLATLSCSLFVLSLVHSSPMSLTDQQITAGDLQIIGSGITFVLSLILINELFRMTWREKGISNRHHVRLWHRMSAWVSGLLLVNSPTLQGTTTTPATVGVPLEAALSPATAASVLALVLRRRREQISMRKYPDHFNDAEHEALGRIQDQASTVDAHVEDDIEFPTTPDVLTVMSAVEREALATSVTTMREIREAWLVEVKVFGFPLVVSANGHVAEFRKKRSLELLTWLTLNRNRARRSAARTALWDIDVSDSTFSTVVSELRRSLREVVGTNAAVEFVPTTYSDELPLSDLVITDAHRLEHEFSRFVSSNGVMTSELREVLQGIRDVPFAGTSYSWADLDGTTTRLIITATDVCCYVAAEMGRQGNMADMHIALTAGLRVLPGCEELLDIQRQYLHEAARLR